MMKKFICSRVVGLYILCLSIFSFLDPVGTRRRSCHITSYGVHSSVPCVACYWYHAPVPRAFRMFSMVCVTSVPGPTLLEREQYNGNVPAAALYRKTPG